MANNSIVRNTPYELRSLQGQLNRLFEPFFGRYSENEELATGSWVPPVDVAEDGEQIVIRVEVPGMKQDDIDISFNDGMLSIKGERKFEKESTERHYHRIERAYGSFVRSFALPRTVDPDRITAGYADGVLELTIPKKEESKPKQIRIGISK